MSRTGARRTVDRAVVEVEARRQAEARRLRNRRLLTSAIVAIVLVGAVVFFATRPAPEALANVQTLPNQGQQHIDANAPLPDYNSDPPTSGPHAAVPAPCGIYRRPVPDVTQIHDLEHGAVVIQYGPETTDEEREQLEDFARDAGTHVIVAPREGMAQKIAVTAWTKLMTMDSVDIAAIEGFYGQFAQFGPEAGVQCPFQVDESQAG
jgi:hypothetical protein